MGKLTKPQLRAHQQACHLLAKDELTFDEKWFIYENWHEGADNNVSAAGAYFTPITLAREFAIDVCGPKVVDLCAGIGALAFAYDHARGSHESPAEITCVEINPAYVVTRSPFTTRRYHGYIATGCALGGWSAARVFNSSTPSTFEQRQGAS